MNQVLAALVNGAVLGALLTAAVWTVLRLTPRRMLNAATHSQELQRLRRRIAEEPS